MLNKTATANDIQIIIERAESILW